MLGKEPEESIGRLEGWGFLLAGSPCRWCWQPLAMILRPHSAAVVCVTCDSPEPGDHTLAEMEATPCGV